VNSLSTFSFAGPVVPASNPNKEVAAVGSKEEKNSSSGSKPEPGWDIDDWREDEKQGTLSFY
jgi:hypothetical protein